jgi:hypothetical protein
MPDRPAGPKTLLCAPLALALSSWLSAMPNVMYMCVLPSILILLLSFAGGIAQPGAITGQLTDTIPLPLPGVTIRIRVEGEVSSRRQYTARADETGHFLVEGLEPGLYQVRATLHGFRTKTLGHVRVVSGKTRDVGPIQMYLAPCGSREGPICDEVH